MTRLSPCILSVACLSACGPATYLARVNDEPVTAEDVRREFVARHGGHEKFLGGEEEARRFLDVVIDGRLLVQEAYRLGLDQDADVVAATEAYEKREAADHLLRKEVDEPSRPSADEVRRTWETKTTRLYDIRQVVCPDAAVAEAARELLVDGEDIEQVALETALGGGRTAAGRVRTVGWGAQDAAWEDVVFSMQPGGLSPVIKSAQGYEVVRLEAVREAEKPPFEKARPRIEAVLIKRRLEERKDALSRQLWSRHGARLADTDPSPQGLARLHRETPDAVLATWNGGALTVKQFFAALDMRELASVPVASAASAIEARLRAVVNDRLAVLEARARGYGRVPEVAEDTRRYRERLMETVLYGQYMLKDVDVAEDEVRAYYDAHRDEATTPERRLVSHIVLPSPEAAREAARRLAEGAEFADVAKEVSTDTASAKGGGSLGWISAREVPPEFTPVLKLEAGQVSEPIASKFGVHLLRVDRIEPATPMAFEAARDGLRQKLLDQRRRERRATWVARLRAAGHLQVSGRGIRAFAREQAAAEPAAPGPRGGHGR